MCVTAVLSTHLTTQTFVVCDSRSNLWSSVRAPLQNNGIVGTQHTFQVHTLWVTNSQSGQVRHPKSEQGRRTDTRDQKQGQDTVWRKEDHGRTRPTPKIQHTPLHK